MADWKQSIKCPKCGVKAGQPCRSLSKAARRLKHPHKWRILARRVTPVFIRGAGWGYPING